MLTPGFSVSVNDTTGLYASYVNSIASVVLAAAAEWQKFLVNTASIEISVLIIGTSSGRADGGSLSSGYVGPFGGFDLFQAGAAYELETGIDPNGSVADIQIQIDPAYLTGELWFDATPATSNDIPVDRTDALSVMIHEIGHGLGFNGWRDWSTGALPDDYLSTFDQFVIVSGGVPYFTGPNARAVYGGDVPLTIGNLFHYGNEFGPGADLVDGGLMNGVYFYRGERYAISELDAAILADTGLSVIAPADPGAPVGYSDQYIVAANGTLSVTAAFGVLANDRDADGDSLTASLSSNAAHGSVSIGADGSFTYTPTAGYVGNDSFNYTAADGTSQSASTTVDIIVGDIDALTRPDQVISQLYVGYYNRAPDPGGLEYWIGSFTTPPSQSSGGVNPFFYDVGHTSASFADPGQAETIALYPFLASPQAANYSDVVAFVVDAYANLFGRTVDGADQGVQYWSTSIAKSIGIAVPTFGDPIVDQTQALQAAKALIALIFGAQGPDALTIANKVAVSLYYLDQLIEHDVAFNLPSAYDALDGVSADPASVFVAQSDINAFIDAAAPPLMGIPQSSDADMAML